MAITLNGTTGVTTTGLTSNGIDDNATSTAMTLDSSGNVLVGTTSSYGDGLTVEQTGLTYIKRNNTGLVVNRTGTDGQAFAIEKDGSTVGSIGTSGGLLNIGSGDTGLLFAPASDLIIPSNPTNTANGGRDAAIDLGNIYNRFKDLYLSGGVYLGGVGAANKLDDYETGSWTPTVTAGSITYANAWYIKIGNLVTLGANVWNFSERSSSSGVEINVPFTSVTGPSAIGSMIGSYITSTTGYSSYIGGNQSRVSFYEAPSNTLYEIMKHNDLSSGSDIHFTIAYYTS